MVSGGKSANAMAGPGGARPQQAEGGRVRGWVLVKSDNPDQTASALTVDLTEGGDEYIIIRADVVQFEMESFARDVNLIVPVDVASADALGQVLSRIRGTAGVRELTMANVTAYYPDPPHRSHTFVTADELSRDRVPEYDPPGRHPKSPGRNGWG